VIRFARFVLLPVCTVQFCLAIAFFVQMPLAVGLWPFPGTTPLTLILVSSFLAAAAASTLWATLSNTYGALAGIGLDYLAVLIPPSIISFRLGAVSGNPGLTTFGVMCTFAVVFGPRAVQGNRAAS
jgi:predicted membrane-bound mannosyltransferase